MKVVLQRVTRAEVRVDAARVGSIGPGILIYLGVMRGDEARHAERLAERCARYRIFPEPVSGPAGESDAGRRMQCSTLETGGSCLVVSQFTLAADGRKGRRPSFDRAAPPEEAEPLYSAFMETLRSLGLTVASGRFGAMMEVESVNDGPVTLLLEET